MIEIRPFQPEDWGVLLELANQAVAFAPGDNIEWLAYRRAFDEHQRTRRHCLATRDGAPVGYGCLEQQDNDPKSLRIYVVCSPENLSGEAGSRLFEKLMREARELEAARLWAREYQADAAIGEFFTRHGFAASEHIAPPGRLPMVVYTLGLAQPTGSTG